MRTLIFLTLSFSAYAQNMQAYNSTCMAPGQGMFEEKLRQAFKLDVGEKELKEIVKIGINYPLREEVKALKRRIILNLRKDDSRLETEVQMKFEQMIQNAETEPEIQNFPYKEAVSKVSTTSDGKLMITMDKLDTEDFDFLPPETLKKLAPMVKVQYHYPIDKFDYLLSYDGKEMPMAKVFQKMQVEHEYECLKRKNGIEQDKNRNGSGTGTGRVSGT